MTKPYEGNLVFPAPSLRPAGMTLRDYFAVQALNGMLSHSTRYKPRLYASRNWHEAIAEEAFQIADAMIAESAKKSDSDVPCNSKAPNSTWLPIDEQAKNGDWIVVMHPEHKHPACVKYSPENELDAYPWEDINYHSFREDEITHYMPIHPLPAKEGE